MSTKYRYSGTGAARVVGRSRRALASRAESLMPVDRVRGKESPKGPEPVGILFRAGQSHGGAQPLAGGSSEPVASISVICDVGAKMAN